MEKKNKDKLVAGIGIASLASILAVTDRIYARIDTADQALNTARLACMIAARDNPNDQRACQIVGGDQVQMVGNEMVVNDEDDIDLVYDEETGFFHDDEGYYDPKTDAYYFNE